MYAINMEATDTAQIARVAKDDDKLLNQWSALAEAPAPAGNHDLKICSRVSVGDRATREPTLALCSILPTGSKMPPLRAARCLELDPRFSAAHVCLGQNYEYLGKEAIAVYKEAISLGGGPPDFFTTACLAHAYAVSGDPFRCRTWTCTTGMETH